MSLCVTGSFVFQVCASSPISPAVKSLVMFLCDSHSGTAAQGHRTNCVKSRGDEDGVPVVEAGERIGYTEVIIERRCGAGQ